MKTLFKNAYVLTMNDAEEVIENSCVLVDGDKIAYVGAYKDNLQADEIIDAKGNIVMPGLVNAHTHLPMTLFKGYGEGLPLDRWLKEKIWPAEDKLTPEISEWCTMLAAIEMVKSGTTALMDMYMGYDAIFKAISASRLRATFTRAVLDIGLPVDTRLKEAEDVYNKYNGKGNISVWMSLHAEYTCSAPTVAKLVAQAKRLNTGIHVHVSETANEHADCLKRNGKTPLAFLSSLGAADVPLAAAHCVHVSDEDIALMAKKQVSVLSCPQSNLKLGSGIAPIAKMVAAGVNVAVGTDGSSSNNNLDMIEETMLISLLQRGINQDAAAISDMQALKMATAGGAAALGKADEIGQLKAGYLADIIMLDTTGMAFTPKNNLVSSIINAGNGRDVCLTMIGGEIVYKDGQVTFANETEVKNKVNQFASKICV